MNTIDLSTFQTSVDADLTAQNAYVEERRRQPVGFGLVVGDAFVRGMRQIGYKSSVTAIDELIDNAIQAGARHIDIFWPPDEKKPSAIAVVDDGHGMQSEMTRYSVQWGGTHREDSREGLGRFGYGLPSACVSQGRRFTVYSKVQGGDWHSVSIDVDDIRDGKYTTNNQIMVPEAQAAKLPTWVTSRIAEVHGTGDLSRGTVVVIEKLDQLTWTTAAGLRENFLEKMGVTHRNFLRDVTLRVDGTVVEPTDPLFLTPGWRYYDVDDDRAEALPPLRFEVKDATTGKSKGEVKVRYSVMPPTFGRVPEAKLNVKSQKNNPRFHVLDENNGLIILRAKRQIDVITRGKKGDRGLLGYINNDDRYWGCEIDFPPTLDEEFAITTTKQQVVMSPRMWDLLQQNGVFLAIRDMRRRYDEARDKLKDRAQEAQRRSSEQTMENIERFKTRAPGDPEELQRHGEETFLKEVQRRAEASGISPEKIAPELRSELLTNKYKVETETLRGAPFYRVDQIGSQKVLYLNTAHPFFTDVYVDAPARIRAALEVMLFVLGEAELESIDERQTFYVQERPYWSDRLRVGLEELDKNIGLRDESPVVELANGITAENTTDLTA